MIKEALKKKKNEQKTRVMRDFLLISGGEFI